MAAFRIREALENDIVGVAKVRVDTWRATYKGIIPDSFLEGLSDQSVADRWRKSFWENRNPAAAAFVAENEYGDIVGIAMCGPEQNQDVVYQAEIYVLYVLPQYQNHGIGRQLVAACLQHLVHNLNVKSLLIWVIAENPYRKFYESLGGKAVLEKTQEIGGRLIREIGYGWEEIDTLLHSMETARS
ncbi:MAG TPA: GNAT family N-acetyltransferase [Anaerolineales bacterium]|nr:GNAT family N-acetyltransferase [Anaerolineales bacterium]